MPFYSSGTLYLPQSVFDASALGVSAVYSSADKTLSLTDQDGHQLVYYLASGTAVTEEGNSYTVSATLRGGIVFVPASYTMQYFGYAISCLLYTSRWTEPSAAPPAACCRPRQLRQPEKYG